MEYSGATNDIDIEVHKVQQQTNSVDCGVFAIAFATHLVHGLDLHNVVFDTRAMREHLIACLDEKEMRVFPVSKGINNIINGRKVSFCEAEKLKICIYCVCKGVYDPKNPMVCCDNCGEWFHGHCVISDAQEREKVFALSNKEDLWYCGNCKS